MTQPAGRLLSSAFLLALFAAGGCGPSDPTPGPPPNLLVLVIDCLRADRVGAASPYPRPVSEHLDALVREGTRFTRAFAQSSWTRPSVPTLLTGLYPSEHGLGSFFQEGEQVTGGTLSPEAVTAAEALRALGYTTALFGQQNQLAPRFGLDQGFDAYDHKAAKADRIHSRLLGWLDAQSKPAISGGPAGGATSTAGAGGAAGSLPRPFFAYLHYLELHWPYCPPPVTRGLFTAGYRGRPLCADWRRLRDDIRSGAVVLTAEEIEALRGHYDEELVALDRDIGALFASLRQRGLWDDTMIVLTADHGEEFFEHGGMAHGTTLYDELLRVPLVIKPPKRWRAPAGATADALVELRDLLPTLLEAAGAELREKPAARSLLALATAGESADREFVVAELGTTIAVRTATHKLIVDRDGAEILYDLERDPGETIDTAAQDPQTVAQLERYLRQWRAGLDPIAPGEEKLDDETIDGLRALGYID